MPSFPERPAPAGRFLLRAARGVQEGHWDAGPNMAEPTADPSAPRTMPEQPTDSPALTYLRRCQEILESIERTQLETIHQVATMCADCIARDGLVHLFGSGHSRMAVEEIFPRYGSFPGFHPIVELSLTYHNAVVGANGQRQAMFLERVEGLGPVILRNFEFGPHDLMMVFSTSGTGAVGVDVALEAKRLGMPVIAVTSVAHSRASKPGHSSGQRLYEVADIVLDNGAVAGDALVSIPGLATPVGPGSTIGNTAIVNAIKCEVARLLTERGQPPLVLTSAHFVGEEESRRLFDAAYDDYRRRVRRL
jgi:uncharacterized phosphosugar-binding protein